MKRVFLSFLSFIAVVAVIVSQTQVVQGASASDWKAGNIISDYMFTDANNMSVDDIQAFLNSKVPNCDTYGTQVSELGGGTRAQYGAANNNPAPFTCLRDYYEVPKTEPSPNLPANNYGGKPIPSGAISAAQIIYNAAQKYSINPKVLLVKIATESAGPLTSDTWPFLRQYTYAMGSHCPDSGPGGSANCDINYSGFSMQLDSAASLMRWYLDSMSQPWWSYKKPYQTNSILWNVVERGCGAGDVYIDSKATAALYTYTPYQPNQAALNNMYGTGDGCSAYGNRNFWRVFTDWFGSTQNEPTIISYRSQLSYYGWTNPTINRGVTGSTGQNRAMEAFRVDGEATYSSYSATTGWQPAVTDGQISGTTTLGRPIQAIKLSLKNGSADKYDVWYRAHVSYIGWMGWVKNGDIAGVTGGNGNNIEAIEIRTLSKGSGAPGETAGGYRDLGSQVQTTPLSVQATAHVGNIGWLPPVSEDMTIGFSERNRRIEALKLDLKNNTGIEGNLFYSAHVAGVGWQPFVKSGEIAGTTGSGLQMEAVRLALSGPLADKYDVWYRGFIWGEGWQGWSKNGEAAGSVGVGRQLEAIDVHILPKNSKNYSSGGGLYNPKSIAVPGLVSGTYSAHISYVGWKNGINLGETAGTTGQSRALEAIRIDSLSYPLSTANISCSVYVRGSGWTDPVPISSQCGTTGQSKPIEAVKLALEGGIADRYALTYQTHSSYVGWTGWVSGGSVSGTPNTGHEIEAIAIKVSPK